MTSSLRRACFSVFVVLFAMLIAVPAFAQAPRVSFQLSTREVRAGEPFTATLLVQSTAADRAPSDPMLKADKSLRVGPPMTSMNARVEVVNGRMVQELMMSATWQLVATREGKMDVGPASFTWNGKTFQTTREVVVVEKGGRAPSPLDPQGEEDTREATEPGVALDAPLEPLAFLRAVVDKDRVVTGEQVTMTVYLYLQRRSRTMPAPTDPHEPSGVDFVQRVLSTGEPDQRPISLGGSSWTVQTLRKIAFFPLRAGELVLEPMSLTLEGDGFRGQGTGGGVVRKAKPVTIHVTEPPKDGRPAGYRLGDVGAYTLQADVDPRAVPKGGSVAVRVHLRGLGNVPFDVRLPEKPGLTFLEAERREQIEARGDTVGGTRLYTYMAKLEIPGTQSLGDVTLPYWDPRAKEYRVAKASLGVVQVLDVGGDRTPPKVDEDPLAKLAPPRTTLSAAAPARAPLASRPWAWGLLLVFPLVALSFEGAKALAARWRAKRAPDDSPKGRLRRALAGDDARDGAFAGRVLWLAVEARTGLGRSVLLGDLEDALVAKGVAEDLAKDVVRALRGVEETRYAPKGEDQTHLAKEAEALAKRLAG